MRFGHISLSVLIIKVVDQLVKDVYKRQADHIVVLEDGHVVQQGTPAELIEQGGLYRRMVELQSESAQWRLLCKK